MKELKGRWCINITKENQTEIKDLIKCGAGYNIGQTIFFNEYGIEGYEWDKYNITWNIDRNNKYANIKYPEIYLYDLKQMLGISVEINYEVY